MAKFPYPFLRRTPGRAPDVLDEDLGFATRRRDPKRGGKRSRRRHVSRRVALGPSIPVALVACAGVAVVTSGAIFTDKADAPGNVFTAGTVNLAVTPASGIVTMTNGYPGGATVKEVTVQNTGSLEYRYAISSVETGDLSKFLRLSVKAGVTDCSETGYDTDGTTLYAPTALSVDTKTAVVGDSTTGWQSGDRVLAPGASERLCFKVAETTDADNSVQGKSGAFTITFDAEQTKNNQWAETGGYLTDGGFESTSNPNHVEPYYGATLGYTTAEKHSGSRAVQFTTDNTTYADHPQGVIVGPNDRVLPAGTRVSESMWFKAPAGTTWGVSQRLEDANGYYSGEGAGWQSITATGGWQQVAFTADGPNYPFISLIQVHAADASAKNINVSGYVDDVTITPLR